MRLSTLDKMIRYNFVPARKEEQFCTCTAPKLYRYSVNARETEQFCIGSKLIRYSVNAASIQSFDKRQQDCFSRIHLILYVTLMFGAADAFSHRNLPFYLGFGLT